MLDIGKLIHKKSEIKSGPCFSSMLDIGKLILILMNDIPLSEF